MAGNGNADRLDAVEKAITGGVGGLAFNPTDDAVKRINRAADQCRQIAHEGKVMEEMSTLFAEHLEKMLVEFHQRLTERLTEMQQMLGPIGK